MQQLEIKRDFEIELSQRLKSPLNFIQVVIGPRQVGKTTGVKRIFDSWSGSKHFAVADSPIPKNSAWLEAQWNEALSLGEGTLLVVDEIQKIEGWAETIKLLFDAQRRKRILQVVLLGSASLSIQEGLVSSLAGRFEIINAHHWSLDECSSAFGWDIHTYLKFGGYPGSAELISSFDRWSSYIRNSIVEPVLGRDISGLVKINKPALFRQAFEMALTYSSQIISLQKLLGQLQERGNPTTIQHYLHLFAAAFLIKPLQKYGRSSSGVYKSSPKILPLNTALSNAFVSSEISLNDPVWKGRVFESAIGAALQRKGGELYYWREGKFEVDFVHVFNGTVTAYEVTTSSQHSLIGLQKFSETFPKSQIRLIDMNSGENILKG